MFLLTGTLIMLVELMKFRNCPLKVSDIFTIVKNKLTLLYVLYHIETKVSKFPIKEHPSDYDVLFDGEELNTEGASLK